MKPVVHGLEAEYWQQIDFVYLDRELGANRDVVLAYDIRYQPVFILINPDGTEVQRWTTFDPNTMRATLDAYLTENGSQDS